MRYLDDMPPYAEQTNVSFGAVPHGIDARNALPLNITLNAALTERLREELDGLMYSYNPTKSVVYGDYICCFCRKRPKNDTWSEDDHEADCLGQALAHALFQTENI